MSRIFLSYAHVEPDRTIARRLYADLVAVGKRPWMDEHDLLPGDTWAAAIEREIRQCKFFVALVSSRSLDRRGYVQSELRQALRVLDTIPTDARFLIPLRLDPCEPQDTRLRELHWGDLFSDYAAGVRQLLGAMGDPLRVVGKLYIDVGLELPVDLASWTDDRFCAYVRGALAAEARERALRDYENVPVRNHEALVKERTRDRLEEVARAFGFLHRLEACIGRRPDTVA